MRLLQRIRTAGTLESPDARRACRRPRSPQTEHHSSCSRHHCHFCPIQQPPPPASSTADGKLQCQREQQFNMQRSRSSSLGIPRYPNGDATAERRGVLLYAARQVVEPHISARWLTRQHGRLLGSGSAVPSSRPRCRCWPAAPATADPATSLRCRRCCCASSPRLRSAVCRAAATLPPLPRGPRLVFGSTPRPPLMERCSLRPNPRAQWCPTQGQPCGLSPLKARERCWNPLQRPPCRVLQAARDWTGAARRSR